MKCVAFNTVLGIFFLFSCQHEPSKRGDLSVIYLEPGPCCSNMEIIGEEEVFSELAGYSESILAAVNIEDFRDLNFKHRDALSIIYEFTSEEYPCFVDCNRHSGIPIRLISVELF